MLECDLWKYLHHLAVGKYQQDLKFTGYTTKDWYIGFIKIKNFLWKKEKSAIMQLREFKGKS